MLRLSSKGSYFVLKQVLIDQYFTQKDIIQQTGLTKGRVSQIIGWMTNKGFLSKNGRIFELLSYKELLRLFKLLRDIEPVFRIRVKIEDIQELFDLLKDLGVVLCESSALCFYDLYCTHKELDFYINKQYLEIAKKRLKKLPHGDFDVKMYISDLPLEGDINYIGAQRVTGEIRTVIDLYTVGKAGEARGLMSKIWTMG
jgi:hypothetical protein